VEKLLYWEMSLLGAALWLGLLVCAQNIRAADQVPDAEQKDRNGGYYLLHNLLHDEADVDKIMLIKNASPEIGRFTKEVSALANDSLATLDSLQDKDPAIHFGDNPLPPIEQAVRDSIKGDKQHQLLFGTKGAAFVRALLVSQIEASMYAKHLATVLADREKNDHARHALEKMSGQWSRMADHAYTLLAESAAR
jgi:hypothetical protein